MSSCSLQGVTENVAVITIKGMGVDKEKHIKYPLQVSQVGFKPMSGCLFLFLQLGKSEQRGLVTEKGRREEEVGQYFPESFHF